MHISLNVLHAWVVIHGTGAGHGVMWVRPDPGDAYVLRVMTP